MKKKITLLSFFGAVLLLSVFLGAVLLSDGKNPVLLLFVFFLLSVLALIFALKIGKTASDIRIDSLFELYLFVKKTLLSEPAEIKEEPESELSFLFQQIETGVSTLAEKSRRFEEGEKRQKHLFDNLDIGLVIADFSGEIVLANNAAYRFLGVSPSNEAKTLTMLLSDLRIKKEIKEITSGAKQKAELTLRGKKGSVFNLTVTRSDSGTSATLLILIRDITELVAAQRVRTDFAANVSHELKTPLTSIKGFAELLSIQEELDRETRHKYLSLIGTETDRLISLINDILKLSRLESIAIREERGNASLMESAKRAKALFAERAKNENITLTFDLLPVSISAEESKIDEIFINLIDNAFKYNKKNGSIHVTVKQETDIAVISVKDSGIGIPKQDIPRIFERFYRVDEGRSKEIEGTGLGLAIVKHIVELYGGTIKVQSEPEEGTEIRIEFPLK